MVLALIGLLHMAFDIKMAYINSEIPLEEQVPIQFEKALRRYDEHPPSQLTGQS